MYSPTGPSRRARLVGGRSRPSLISLFKFSVPVQLLRGARSGTPLLVPTHSAGSIVLCFRLPYPCSFLPAQLCLRWRRTPGLPTPEAVHSIKSHPAYLLRRHVCFRSAVLRLQASSWATLDDVTDLVEWSGQCAGNHRAETSARRERVWPGRGRIVVRDRRCHRPRPEGRQPDRQGLVGP
jgi:hypothetical protein